MVVLAATSIGGAAHAAAAAVFLVALVCLGQTSEGGPRAGGTPRRYLGSFAISGQLRVLYILRSSVMLLRDYV